MINMGKNNTINPTSATIRSKHHLKKNPILCLFCSTLHGLHVEYCLNALQRYYFSEWVQHFDGHLHPPAVMYLKLAIGFAEVEILNQKVVYLGMLGDATGTIADIIKTLFFKVIFIQEMV